MLVTGIVAGLIAGFLLGGSVANLLANTRRLRWLGLLALGAIVRFGTEIALNAGVPGVEATPPAALRVRVRAPARRLLVQPQRARLRADPRRHVREPRPGHAQRRLDADLGAGPDRGRVHARPTSTPRSTRSSSTRPGPAFLLRGGPLGDVIPIPFPVIQNVASVGDLILAVGLAWFSFAAVLRRTDHHEEAVADASLPGATDVAGLDGAARLPRSVEADGPREPHPGRDGP